MRKAVLVFNMPQHCRQCFFYDKMFEICRYKYKDIQYKEGRPNWCPLKPLPEEDNTEEYFNEWSRGYQGGWNDCINVIVGGSND